MSIFWTNAGDDFIKQRNAWMAANGYPASNPSITDIMFGSSSEEEMAAKMAEAKRWEEGQNAWFAALPPEQAKQAYEAFAARDAHFDKTNKIGSALALGIIGAAAGGAALTAGGVLGGAAGGTGGTGTAAAAAPGATTAAGGALPAFNTGVGGLFGSQAAIDSALASTAGGLGSTSGLTGGALLGAGGIAAPSLGTAALGGAAALTPSLLNQAMPQAPGSGPTVPNVPNIPSVPGSLFDWGNALLTAGGIGATVAAMTSGEDMKNADPRLFEAQLRSMGFQQAAVEQIMATAAEQKNTAARLLPQQEAAMNFGLETGKTAYDQSQADRAWLLDRRNSLTGLQDTMVNEANAFNAASVGDTRAAAAQTDITKAFGDIQQAEARRMAGMGVLPGSGRYQALNSARAVDQARAGVGAANEARLGARNEGRALVDRAAGALAAYPSAASAQTVLGANLGAGQVNTANAGAAGINSNYGSLTGAQQAASGVASQLGGNATSMYGAQTSRDSAQAVSQNAANENLYAGIGSLLGGATKWWNTKQP